VPSFRPKYATQTPNIYPLGSINLPENLPNNYVNAPCSTAPSHWYKKLLDTTDKLTPYYEIATTCQHRIRQLLDKATTQRIQNHKHKIKTACDTNPQKYHRRLETRSGLTPQSKSPHMNTKYFQNTTPWLLTRRNSERSSIIMSTLRHNLLKPPQTYTSPPLAKATFPPTNSKSPHAETRTIGYDDKTHLRPIHSATWHKKVQWPRWHP
jgi:hypothetical protein